MAQHPLLAAAHRTMCFRDALDIGDLTGQGDEAYAVWTFVITAYGKSPLDVAQSMGWTLGRTRPFLNRIRRIMREQVDMKKIVPQARCRHTIMLRTSYAGEAHSTLVLAEAVWRDKFKYVDTKSQFEAIWNGMKA